MSTCFLISRLICIGFCTAGREEPSIQGVCNGDSGSPLMTKINGRIQIIGVASASFCYGPDNVFVNVGKFVPWIQKNLDKFVDPPNPYYNLPNKIKARPQPWRYCPRAPWQPCIVPNKQA